MSLINEALKKAQRSRGDAQAGETEASPGKAGPVAKRGKARSSQTIVLIASGAIVLVVLTGVATFWLANRPSPQPERPVAKQPAPAPAAAGETPSIVVPSVNPAPLVTPAPATNPDPSTEQKSTKVVENKTGQAGTAAEIKAGTTTASPVTTIPATTPAPSTATAAAPSTPVAPSVPAANPASTASTGTGSAPNNSSEATTTGAAPTVAPPAPAGPPKPDERIAAYVEALRITAIRANDAKVIMNEKVYRVNDIVERTLGVRLIKVASDSLTFADANGVTYIKYF